MKELTTEQKAQRYDEVLNKAKNTIEVNQTVPDIVECVESLFPELKENEESNDEEIRKVLLELISTYLRGNENGKIHGVYAKDILDWLEKQGEQKPADKYIIRGIKSKHAEGKLGEMIKEMKSADKIESKFHEGEWVVWDNKITCHIDSVYHGKFSLMYTITDTNNMVRSYSVKGFDSNARLWDITKDAKDGDVLAVEPIDNHPSPFIAIYKERGLNFFNSYCFISFDGKFNEGTTGHSIYHVHPATKEQRDTLMKAMADAGYTFDFENKELKKIEQKPAEWSEEDNIQLQAAINICKSSGHTITSDWLKSLRPQPKQEWSTEDEKNLNFLCELFTDFQVKSTENEIKHGTNSHSEYYYNIKKWLKSLKERIGV